MRGQTARKRIELSFVTPYPLPGELCLDLPPGWQGAFLTPDGPRPTLTMPEPAPGTPSALEVELQVPAGAPGACEALRLHFSGEYELDFDLPLLLADEGTVRVERQSLDGQGVLAVSNGVLRFSVLDGLSGSLIRLQDAQGRAYFYDNVPQVMPWFFFENHVGGVQPMVAGMRIEVLFGELEALHVEAVEEGLWAGAEVSWQALKDEYLRGQQFRLAYLTLPGSSVVRVRLRHHNPTPRRVEWFGSVLVNVALGGSAEGTVVHAPGGQGTWVRNPAPKPFVNPGHLGQPWVNLLKGEQSLALLIPRGHLAAAQVLDFPEFVMGVMYSAMETDPQGENEIEFALALNQADEHVKPLIAALGR